MDKIQLVKNNKGMRMYDISSYRELRNYKIYRATLLKLGKTTERMKTIAPFGRGYEADMYYFEESQAVSGSALLELGFSAIHSQYYTITVNGFTINYKIVNGSGAFFIDDKKIQVKTLEQIYTLILLL